MKKRILSSMAGLLASAGMALGQPGVETPPSAPVSAAPAWQAPTMVDDSEMSGPRLWVSTEYLLWWLKDQSLGTPMLTTGPAATGGALGAAGTTSLTPANLDYGTISGLRLTAGGWLNSYQDVGLEASGFLLERAASGFGAVDVTGATVLAQPLNTPAGGTAIPASSPGLLAGGVGVTSTNRFWGSEINMIARAYSSGGFSTTLLGGFRYLDLNETLQSASPAVNLAPTSLGPVGTVSVFNDYWSAHNQFYGGQLGTRFDFQRGRLFLNSTVKLALGSTHEVMTVNGNFLVAAPGAAPTLTPGGAYTGATNIGRFKQDEFTAIPELQANVGYELTQALRLFVGYNFIYWSNVVRPADQFDLNVSATQPVVRMDRDTFWAHGLNFGMEFRY